MVGEDGSCKVVYGLLRPPGAFVNTVNVLLVFAERFISAGVRFRAAGRAFLLHGLQNVSTDQNMNFSLH